MKLLKENTTCRGLNQKGYTLMEIIAVLVILSVLAATAIAKYTDVESSSKQRILQAAVTELNGLLFASWYKSLLEKGTGDFQYFDASLDGDIVITNQESGKQPKDGLIYFQGDSVKYQIFWVHPNGNPGQFVLGDKVS